MLSNSPISSVFVIHASTTTSTQFLCGSLHNIFTISDSLENPQLDLDTVTPRTQDYDPPSAQKIIRRPTSDAHALQLIDDAHKKGHFGTRAVHSHLAREGWCWPGMSVLIDQTCSACHTCQQWNASRRVFHPLRAPMASLPWDVIHMDLQTSMDRDIFGMKILLVITDLFTSYTILRALPDKEEHTVAATLWQIFGDFGPPRQIQSDGGAEFTNKVIKAIIKSHGIEHRTIPAYNPRSAGLVESHGHTAACVIRKLTAGSNNWSSFLPSAQLFMNDKIKNSTNAAPFALLFNRAVNEFQSYANMDFNGISTIDHDIWLARERHLHQIIFPIIRDRKDILKNQRNANFVPHQTTTTTLPIGTLVYLKDPREPRNKNTPAWDGPYTISEVTSNNLYKLRDTVGGVHSRAVTRDMIKVKRTTDLVKDNFKTVSKSTSSSSASSASSASHLSSTSPSTSISTEVDDFIPLNADGSQSYYVDALVGHRYVPSSGDSGDGSGVRIQYLCKWRGFNDPTWIEREKIEDEDLIRQYSIKHRLSRTRMLQYADQMHMKAAIALQVPAVSSSQPSSSKSSSKSSSSKSSISKSSKPTIRVQPLLLPAATSFPRESVGVAPLPSRQLRSSQNKSQGSVHLIRHISSPGPLLRIAQRAHRNIISKHANDFRPSLHQNNLHPTFLQTHINLISHTSSVEQDICVGLHKPLLMQLSQMLLVSRKVGHLSDVPTTSSTSSSSNSTSATTSSSNSTSSSTLNLQNSTTLSSSYYSARPLRLKTRLAEFHL